MPDGNDATSEAIFVFTGSARRSPSATRDGQRHRRRSSGPAATANLTITEIDLALDPRPVDRQPAAAADGHRSGGRVPPTTVIDDDTPSGSTSDGRLFDPETDGIDFYESLEGMRVQVNDAVAVGPDDRLRRDPRDPGRRRAAAEPHAIEAGSSSARRLQPRADHPRRPISAADAASRQRRRPLHRHHGRDHGLQLRQLQAPGDRRRRSASPRRLRREVTAPPAPGELSVATFNVENLDPDRSAGKFAAGRLIVDNLQAPDIIALEEIQDNNGPTNDTAPSTPTRPMRHLIAAIQAAGGPTYSSARSTRSTTRTGANPAATSGSASCSAPTAASSSSTAPVATRRRRSVVPPERAGPSSRQPRPRRARQCRRSPTAASRWPASSRSTAETLFVIANHFNSKGGDDPLFGRFQPPYS